MKKFHSLLLVTFLFINSFKTIAAASVQLDEYTFDKLLSKFDATLVKFDVAFPYGTKHDVYVAIAKDSRSVDDLLIAEVGVKDYGERDNEALAKKYNVKKEDFPVVKLFVKNHKEPYTFSGDFTTDSLRDFIKDKAGVHVTLPGCIASLDSIAMKFSLSNNDVRKSLLKEAEEVILGLEEKFRSVGSVYKSLMNKVIEKGIDFIKGEHARVKKLLDGKLAANKQQELNTKVNILMSFGGQTDGKKKDEF